jgi:hypothetical protein
MSVVALWNWLKRQRADADVDAASLVAAMMMLEVDDLEFDFFSDISEGRLASPWKFNSVMKINSAVENGEIFHLALERSIEYQANLSQLGDEDFLNIQFDQGNKVVMYAATRKGQLIGSFPRKGPLSEAIKRGMIPATVELGWVKEPYGRNDLYTAFVIVSCIHRDDFHEIKKYIEESSQSINLKRKTCTLSGSDLYSQAVNLTKIGEVIEFRHEFDNLIRDDAIVARRMNGEKLGYVSNESCIFGLLVTENRKYRAKISSIRKYKKSHFRVDVSVSIGTKGLGIPFLNSIF